ncbi:hypothetical protein SCLCIDRAFT_120776 [Scleroderma citrinum Foug A]|uniref:Uncharacterized protein n=1 Tax=Scleroderma citrinum Foug A TaxID=1036808 RepID=A0A0C3E1E0_9AGAM|nr:hypothetical protein SCLCIDRAFT_120776 [Scleroderma citrinum Foug A]
MDLNLSILVPCRTKKQNTKDLLTIFSNTITVRFAKEDGTSEMLRGWWCMICR